MVGHTFTFPGHTQNSQDHSKIGPENIALFNTSLQNQYQKMENKKENENERANNAYKSSKGLGTGRGSLKL